MGRRPLAVVDANVLLNLATPVVDGRDGTPSRGDPLRAVLTAYDVRAPRTVFEEVTAATGSGDLLSAAADAVLRAAHHVETRDVAAEIDGELSFGLDAGESRAVWLANDLDADLLVTDEFATSNYLLVSMELDDRNTLFTSPHVCCKLAERGILPVEYTSAVLTYLCDRKDWDETYVDRLRAKYLQ